MLEVSKTNFYRIKLNDLMAKTHMFWSGAQDSCCGKTEKEKPTTEVPSLPPVWINK